VKFELDDYNRNISDDLLLDDLRSAAKKIGKPSITHEEYNLNGKYSSTTYLRRFGSWFVALEKAGLQKTRTPANIPEEELYRNLEEIWIKLGRQPRYNEVQKSLSKYHVGTYENRFGSWRKALEKFVVYINNEEAVSSEEAIKNAPAESSTRHKTKRNINWRLRFIVMRRGNFKCKNCGQSPATDPSIILHVDHVKAWANGGETVQENLQTLCSKCNIGKSDLESHE
jgi:hypothetical protein